MRERTEAEQGAMIPAPFETIDRKFPIKGPKHTRESIPWRVLAPHEAQALTNHGETLKHLAERGGLCWSEAYGILKGVGWRHLPRGQEDRCKAEVLAVCQRETPGARA